ncbi:MAG: SEL1-like repeat protein, partial [Planctomycetota bacterium]
MSKKRRFVKAFLRAEQGDPAAQYRVGMMYYSGQQVPQNSALAALWFTKAARQGYSDAQYFLSLIYGLGEGVTQSDRKAAEWAQKAAEQGHADAQYSLGRMYSTGQGLLPDDVQAVVWLTKAAEQGHADAQCDLGMMYKSGRGVKRNTNHAIQWWVKASQQGHAWSGLLLQEAMQTESVPSALARIDRINEEADQLISNIGEDLGIFGDPEPIKTTGQIPIQEDSDSIIVDTIPSEIIEEDSIRVVPEPATIEKDSADQAIETMDASAQYDLAVLYYDSKGGTQDYAKTIKWFTAAAEQGHAEAQYKLGVM